MTIGQAITVAITAGIFSLIGSAFGAVLQRQTEKDKALEAEKRQTYKNLLKFIFDMLSDVKRGALDQKLPQHQETFFELARDLNVYASDEVLKLFILFRKPDNPPDPGKFLGLMAKLILTIRQDLGHTSTTVTANDLLGSFIDDLSEIKITLPGSSIPAAVMPKR